MNDGNSDVEESPASCTVNDEFLEGLDVSLDEVGKEKEEIGHEENGLQMVCGKKRNVVAGFARNVDESQVSCTVKDEFLERLDVSWDELQRIRKNEEEFGRKLAPVSDCEENGFQMVCGKTERTVGSVIAGSARNISMSDVELAERDKKLNGKAKVPFHVPTIEKKTPEKYNVSTNQPFEFEHVWFETSEDGQRVQDLSVDLQVSCSLLDAPLERLDVSLDELQRIQKEEEEICRPLTTVSDCEKNGFQMVCGKKEQTVGNTSMTDVKLAESYKKLPSKVKVPFHVPTIKKKTREKYNVSANQPFEFEHVWLMRSDYSQQFMHPPVSKVLKLEINASEFLLQHFCEATAYKAETARLQPAGFASCSSPIGEEPNNDDEEPVFNEYESDDDSEAVYIFPDDTYMIMPRRSAIRNLLPRELLLRLNNEVSTTIDTKCTKEILGEDRYKLLLETKPISLISLSDSLGHLFLFWKTGGLSATYLLTEEQRQKLKDCLGSIRDQRYHSLCWAYVVADLISASRKLYGCDTTFTPLCTHYLCQKVLPKLFARDALAGYHRCYGCQVKVALAFVQEKGIPKEMPGEEVFDCTKERPKADEHYYIKNIFCYPSLEEALRRLKTHPIAASLLIFEGWTDFREIYRGPAKKGAKFKSHHAVIIRDCIEIDGEMIAVCRSSNGREIGYDGEIYVSLEIMLICVGVVRRLKKPDDRDDHFARCYPIEPTHLLYDFYSIDVEVGEYPSLIHESEEEARINRIFQEELDYEEEVDIWNQKFLVSNPLSRCGAAIQPKPVQGVYGMDSEKVKDIHARIDEFRTCMPQLSQVERDTAELEVKQDDLDVIIPTTPDESSDSRKSIEWYGGWLKSAPSVASHLLTESPFVKLTWIAQCPLLLIDARMPLGSLSVGCKERLCPAGTGSLYNEGEADTVVNHVISFIYAGVSQMAIAVQSPYVSEVQLLRERLDDFPVADGIEVATIDSFQGRKADAVIIAMVRSTNLSAVGFRSRGQMDVAITRAAQKHVTVVCNSSTICYNTLLARLLHRIHYIRRVKHVDPISLGGSQCCLTLARTATYRQRVQDLRISADLQTLGSQCVYVEGASAIHSPSVAKVKMMESKASETELEVTQEDLDGIIPTTPDESSDSPKLI